MWLATSNHEIFLIAFNSISFDAKNQSIALLRNVLPDIITVYIQRSLGFLTNIKINITEQIRITIFLDTVILNFSTPKNSQLISTNDPNK